MVIKKIIIYIGILLFSCLHSAQNIDSSLSKVHFEVKNMGFNTVKGSLSQMTGTVLLSPDLPRKPILDICLAVNTINTNNKKRDDNLRDNDFFEIEKYPNICIVSHKITKKLNTYILKGNLSMHGITKPVEIELYQENKVIKGSFSINRYDFNLGNDTSRFMVSDVVKIDITCVLK